MLPAPRGLDALKAPSAATREIDGGRGAGYDERPVEFAKLVQRENLIIGGAMTDVKGHRGLPPSRQEDLGLFVRVVKRGPTGVPMGKAEAHGMGCIDPPWIIVMPTVRLRPEDGH